MKLKGIISFLRGWRVEIVGFLPDSVIVHKATSFNDALEWASCYGADCTVNIRNKFGSVANRVAVK